MKKEIIGLKEHNELCINTIKLLTTRINRLDSENFNNHLMLCGQMTQMVADIEALRHDHDKLKIKIKLNSLETAISSKISDDASAANNRLKILQNRLKKGLTAAIERAQISAEASAAFDRLKHSDLS